MFIAFAAVALASCTLSAVEWRNLEDENYVAGRKCSSGYLQGKVVLVCSDVSLASRLEEVWNSFKTKPFVVLGTFGSIPKGVSFPVYRGAEIAGEVPMTPLYVTDGTGRVRYKGVDERKATEVVVMLLTDYELPKNETQWRQFLDFEFAELPGRACLRYRECKKKMPKVASDYKERYDGLYKDPEVKQLVDLVRFAKAAKDVRAFDPGKARLQKSRLAAKLKEAQTRFAPLKESTNPKIVREAKNSLADLKWTSATL